MRVGRMDADDPVQTLADALDLEPSSGFGARVRDGIEADRAARRRTWRYAMAVAVPAAVALVVVWSAHRPIDEQPRAMSSRAGAVMPSETRVAATTTEDASASTERSGVAVAARAMGESPRRNEERHGKARVARNAWRAFAAAPVVVPRGQLEGVRQLASAAASGRVRIGPSLADWAAGVQPEAAALQAPDPIRVPALDVEPIVN